MSESTKWSLRHLGLDLSADQWWAFCYLEHFGKRFLVDFGTDNAVAKADAMWRVCPLS